MGDIANDVIEGFICQSCLSIMPDYKYPGYPRTCSLCVKEEGKRRLNVKVKCPMCHKRVKVAGLEDHQHDVHGDKK